MKKISIGFVLTFVFVFSMIGVANANFGDVLSYLQEKKIVKDISSPQKLFYSMRKLTVQECADLISKSAKNNITFDDDSVLTKPCETNFFIESFFKAHGVSLTSVDFVDQKYLKKHNNNPYLAYADILNLSKIKTKNVKLGQALKFINQFEEQKEYISKDSFYAKIAAHEHYRKGTNIQEYFKAAGAFGIQKTVFLPTGGGPNNKGYEKHQEELLAMQKKYPDKIYAMCTVDEQDPDAPKKIEDCVKKGGKGLKLMGWHPEFYDEEFDSENMMKIYEKARELKLTVLFHGSIMNIPNLEEKIPIVLKKFPEVTFVHAHYCSSIMQGINLEKCAKILDEFPNFYIDLTMGGGLSRYLGYFENPEYLQKTVDFIIKYQDRIMSSTDFILGKSDTLDSLHKRMACDYWLQQKNTYSCPVLEPTKERKGFALPKEVLQKLYYDNAKKAYKL